MKKILSFLILAALALSFASCGTALPNETTAGTTSAADETDAPKTVIRVGGLTGPTSMGLVKVMADDENNNAANDYEFTIVGSADELTPKLIQGQLDAAAIPANLAAVLYKNTNGALQIAAVNTLGVLYIVEKGETVNALDDLKGKTIYATGKGSVPEYNLRYILLQNGINPDKDITIEWKSEPAEVVALLSAKGGVAMLPQPYVTIAKGSVEGLRTVLDLTGEWEKLNNGSLPITGVLVVRRDFAEANPQAMEAFLAEYKASAEFVNANTGDAAADIEKFGIFKAAVAEKAIPFCNITFLSGSEMKNAIKGYLEVLFGQNPASVGGVMPDDNFYYEK